MNIYVEAVTKEEAVQFLKELDVNPEGGTLSRLAHCEELWCFIPREKKENDD